MTGNQHRLIGLTTGTAIGICLYSQDVPSIAVALPICTAIVGSMFPDIDHDSTKIGKTRKKVMKICTALFITLGLSFVIATILELVAIHKGVVDSDNHLALLVGGIACFGLLTAGLMLFKNTDCFQWMIHHRGFTHTLIIPLISAGMCFYLGKEAHPCLFYTLIGFIAGYMSHIIADMCTVAGCPILWPITRNKISIMPLHTSAGTTWIMAIILAILPIAIVSIKCFV